MNVTVNKLTSNLKELSRRTESGEIAWLQASPTVFNWDQGNGLVASIQRAGGPTQRVYQGLVSKAALLAAGIEADDRDGGQYLFQVVEKASKNTVVSLSSKERPELKGVLERIFSTAQASVDVSASKVLDELLGF
ncbi:hypothetical protein [Pseudomonas sp. OHS18]|uniref:hypothetical protein n=1 Tax=Pseudomonas sp. OHS18 TaxID=3399679 RepID=UPI003A86ED14